MATNKQFKLSMLCQARAKCWPAYLTRCQLACKCKCNYPHNARTDTVNGWEVTALRLCEGEQRPPSSDAPVWDWPALWPTDSNLSPNTPILKPAGWAAYDEAGFDPPRLTQRAWRCSWGSAMPEPVAEGDRATAPSGRGDQTPAAPSGSVADYSTETLPPVGEAENYLTEKCNKQKNF